MLTDHMLDGSVVDKVQIAIERLRTFEPADGYYVAFSGGKDSIVVKDLVQRSGVRYDIHMHLTSVDPPELLRYVRAHHADVELVRPAKTMWQLIAEHGMPPIRQCRYCCRWLKEQGGGGRVVVTGVRWAESARRAKRRMVEVCMRDKTKTYAHPIIDWSDAEVWEYIRERQLPYCCLYDEGFTRIGCVGCPMGSRYQRDKQFARWPGFEHLYRKAFEAASKHRRKGRKWSDGESMWDWWMADKRDDTHPDRGVLFE